MCKWLYVVPLYLCHAISVLRKGEEMGPYFPSGHRELADWSGDSVIDNVAALPRRQPDSPEEREAMVLIAQVDKVVSS